MNRRVRSLAGLLGLLALSASFAESVLASTCATMTMTAGAAMETDGAYGSLVTGAPDTWSAMSSHAAGSVVVVDPATGSPVAMAAPASASESDSAVCERDFRSAPSDEHPCPFESPLAAQTCLGVVSLPSRLTPLPLLQSHGPMRELSVAVRAGLLPDGALFRPPRA